PLRFAVLLIAAEAQLPEAGFFAAAIALQRHHVAGLELADAGDDGARRRYHGMKAEVVVERYRIDALVDIAACEQRRQCRGETQALFIEAEIERLDAQSVARQIRASAV